MFKNYLLILLFAPFLLTATELSPWLGPDFIVETRGIYRFQAYRQISTNHGYRHRNANDSFFTLGAAFAALDWSAELETSFARTHRQNPGWDNLRLTGRHRLTNDISGENWLTITPGLTITQACTNSLRDISSFHHGRIEAELHLAIGKEQSYQEYWTNRWWGLLGIGDADQGWPWLHAELSWERNWLDQKQLRVYVESLFGFGHHDLHANRPFRGYGNIRHRSVDIGAKYSHLLDCGVVVSGEYAFRVYARNFPVHASQVVISLYYPFAITSFVLGL